jgi:hypothetical protein
MEDGAGVAVGAGVGVGPVEAPRLDVGIPSRLKYELPPLAGIAGLKFTVPELPDEKFENVDVGP